MIRHSIGAKRSAGRHGALGILLGKLEGCWDVPQACPVQLGLGTGRTEIFNWGFGAKKSANGVRFRYVQADAGTKIGRGDPAKMSA